MQGETPSIFRKDWWSGKMMEWSMKDEEFKVEMFRFVDVFPTLRDHVQLAEHIQEYFCQPDQDFPASFQWGLSKVKPDGWIAKKASGQIKKQIVGMAEKFIAGTDAAEAIDTLEAMWVDDELAFTLDLLGEATVSEAEANSYFERYDEILETLCEETTSWPERPALEDANFGDVPRVNLSVKISSLYSQLDPIDPQGSVEAVKRRLRPLFRKARERNAFINLDVEQYRYKDLTYRVFKSILDEDEFSDFPHAGIVCQAYLRDSRDDLESLARWAKDRGTPVTVRLVKGAYWDYETIHAEQQGWPIPVYTEKWETDRNFEACTEFLVDNHAYLRPAIASHNVRSIAHAMVYASEAGLDKSGIEFQMLYGMAEPMKAAVRQLGYRLRDYVPIGEMIPGMAYLVRRLLENTSNESWLRQSFAEGESLERLLQAPEPPPGASETSAEPRHGAITDHGFKNEPVRDFSHAEARQSFAEAVDGVEAQLGGAYDVYIGGESVAVDDELVSHNPARPDQIVGRVGCAGVEEAKAAVEAADEASSRWAATSPDDRAQLLFDVADKMRERRDELSAWMVWEVGKNWREADADVCEAIDFCDYYAREMKRIGSPKRLGRLPGELNHLAYRPRGVAAVIAPWNFPLAILTGMTMAAAVTGNTVVVKPAEQSPVIAAKLVEICREVGFPDGVINFVPGVGEVVGRAIVESSDVDLVAFTGSKAVGLEILEQAGRTPAGQHHVKQVVCEMGGKNAIVVDADADLDEAVQGVVHSAYGFQGQKCSACSRAIVHESCYDEFVERLVEATKSLVIGSPTDPGIKVGPVIDDEAKQKIESYIEVGKQEGSLLVQREVRDEGYFVGPTVFEDIDVDDRLAQEEIFGPVLSVMKAESFEEGIEMANATRFALTGGVYSRSPENLEYTRNNFDVGNLYINRGITGALVYRNPFGGYKLSGVGSKAGGPDYLKQFMVPRTVVENTIRRGFAPEE